MCLSSRRCLGSRIDIELPGEVSCIGTVLELPSIVSNIEGSLSREEESSACMMVYISPILFIVCLNTGHQISAGDRYSLECVTRGMHSSVNHESAVREYYTNANFLRTLEARRTRILLDSSNQPQASIECLWASF